MIPNLTSFVIPQYAPVYSMERDVKHRIKQLIDRYDQCEVEMQKTDDSIEKLPFLETPSAIYPAILANPEVPLLKKSQSRLEDGAIFLMLAGTDAPSRTLAITMFHILRNPATYQRLKDELFAALPDVKAVPCIDQLENVPYLTFVSMSTYFILRDPSIFPEPEMFLPERRLLEPEELQNLEKFLLPASKGTLYELVVDAPSHKRSCASI
ncbi:uncharacterized protein N7446_003953 [Penicillium canescens]|uniref:Cytochrome P450 n=1 Tax=Penicillium canescens TaxID=5083 RepID=A0AAD6I232_PENCN|nr:uncharacterized protein N7446_003953 [Penicillium canescens]KAJ6027455.1 hypothetical protein N7460_012272 [Penicillium canescens]KAJ6040731.1 hypothetical protein N7444_009636 [Penicillium canescens]KAJ6066916.1 hypothetical protein N7446_003953 [Penicillium canescens]